MNWISHRANARCIVLGVAICGVALLTGCQNKDKTVVAKVNAQSIVKETWVDKTLASPGFRFRNDPGHEVGADVLFTMMTEELIKQAAESVKGAPTDADVAAMVALQKRDPRVKQALQAGFVTDDELSSSQRIDLEEFGIGVNGQHASATDIDKYYTEHKQQFTQPETWMVQSLPLPSDVIAEQAIKLLQMGQPMQKVAQQLLSLPPQIAASQVNQQLIRADILKMNRPDVWDLLKNSAPNAVGAKPIHNRVKNASGKEVDAYFIFQLTDKTDAWLPSAAEIRPFIEKALLEPSNAGWREHANSVIRDFAHKATLEVDIDRYKPLVQTMLMPQFEHVVPEPPAMGGAPPTQAAPSGTRQPAATGTPRR